MMNKLEKKFKRCLVVFMASIIAISLMGCESKELAKGDAVNKEAVVEKNSVNNNKADSKELHKTEAVSIEKTENNKDNNEDTKETKTTATSKSPEVKKQSNLEKAVLQNSKPIDKSKIGDKIGRFKEVFGSPVSDKNGDAHFKYNSIFLSVNYDTKTGETYAVYILRKDF